MAADSPTQAVVVVGRGGGYIFGKISEVAVAISTVAGRIIIKNFLKGRLDVRSHPTSQKLAGERVGVVKGEREIYFKSHFSLWEHSSHFRLIGRGVPSVLVVS